jgi:hypothetical protein
VSGRWERVLDQKPVSLRELLLDEAAKLLLAELGQWPLPVEEIDEQTGAGIAELLASDATRPSPAVLATALRLARWDLDREHEAYDDFMRNRRYQEGGITERATRAAPRLALGARAALLAVGRDRRSGGPAALPRPRRPARAGPRPVR